MSGGSRGVFPGGFDLRRFAYIFVIVAQGFLFMVARYRR